MITVEMLYNKIMNSIKKPYVGVPAPDVLEDDPWFGPAVKSSKTLAREAEMVYNEEVKGTEDIVTSKEPENIHQLMYEMATKNVATTLALNPPETFGGGSEQYHEGPGGWTSGNGMGQFRD